jgi:hypothetical protein
VVSDAANYQLPLPAAAVPPMQPPPVPEHVRLTVPLLDTSVNESALPPEPRLVAVSV